MQNTIWTRLMELLKGALTVLAIGLLGLFLGLVAILILAGLIFVGLSLLTDWNLLPRVMVSVLAAFATLKVLGLVGDLLGLIPQKSGGTRETKTKPFPQRGPPCPKCTKPLATALAQQCLHCGADWHGQNEVG